MGKLTYKQPVEALWLFWVKIAAVAVVIMAFAWQIANARGLPVVLILLAVLILVYAFVTQQTVFGRHIYAMGGNLQAAKLSGVKTKLVNMALFVNMGVLAAIAGVVYSARSNSAQPGAGNMFELDAIAAAFIGGAAVTGGVGKVQGAIIGGLIMAVMANGMQIMGIGQDTQSIVRGVVLVLAVAFDVYNKRRSGSEG
jgi:putative multiple sugar transport system permease protein